jgi:hypothetical protein
MAHRPFAALLLALPLCGGLLGGCVMVPNHVTTPTVAGIGQIKLIVPQPQADATAPRVAYVSALSWNRARLTLTPKNGQSPAVTHILEDHGDGLQVQDDIGAMPPGQYSVKVDLVESAASGAERVVASGLLDGDSAPKLNIGVNNLEVMVHPALPGTHVAPIASAMWVSSRQTTWHSNSHVVVEDPAWTTATNVAIIAGAVVQAIADSHHSSGGANSQTLDPLPKDDRVSDPYAGDAGSSNGYSASSTNVEPSSSTGTSSTDSTSSGSSPDTSNNGVDSSSYSSDSGSSNSDSGSSSDTPNADGSSDSRKATSN